MIIVIEINKKINAIKIWLYTNLIIHIFRVS